ncbi:hypothetical protein LX36DRAFT_211833 [Colletotrichum falcatum]|nr:hypothetical protein LX36DRAFT_211833 [Colletotrichum falcatum]
MSRPPGTRRRTSHFGRWSVVGGYESRLASSVRCSSGHMFASPVNTRTWTGLNAKIASRDIRSLFFFFFSPWFPSVCSLTHGLHTFRSMPRHADEVTEGERHGKHSRRGWDSSLLFFCLLYYFILLTLCELPNSTTRDVSTAAESPDRAERSNQKASVMSAMASLPPTWVGSAGGSGVGDRSSGRGSHLIRHWDGAWAREGVGCAQQASSTTHTTT